MEPFDLSDFKRVNALVIGDVMLDRYLWGRVSRISPEAPVPVVKVESRTYSLGGAANVAANLAALGCRVCLLGTRGSDDCGATPFALLKKMGLKIISLPLPRRAPLLSRRGLCRKASNS